MIAFLAMLLCFASPAFAENVAKIGDTEYATLSAAMTEANKAAGNYTISLLQNSAEVFTFAQKSGVNITIDGVGYTFSGKITLNAGKGNLTFTNAKIAPAYSQTIYLNASTAPNVTFDGCTLQGADKSGTIVYGYASATSNALTIKNCTADNLQYIVSHRQTGSNSVLVENVTATNMIYLVRTLKCPSVTVKNVTCDAVIGIEIKNDGADGKLTLEDVNINVYTYSGSLYHPVNGSGAGKSWTIELKGKNQFSADGVPYTGNDWFSGNEGYEIVDLNPIEVGEKTYATLAKAIEAANAGETVKLVADATGAGVVINKDVTIDFNGKTYTVNKTVGSAGTTTLGLQILKDNNVTLKNGSLKSTAVVEGKEVKMLIQNYANLTIEDMNLVDNTNHILYVLSNNSGEVNIKGATNITTDAVAFDACKYANYTIPTVTVNTTGKITGAIEVTGGNLAIKGGTFTTPLDPSWFEAGYSAKDNGDGTYSVTVSAAKIGEKTYETLAAAISAAKAGETITLLSDRTENVTISKNLTIDGAGKTYTGTMTVNNVNATIQNVAFVEGQVYKDKKTGSNAAIITIKDCTFDGQGLNAYAVNLGGTASMVLEDIKATGYGYGLLQVPSSCAGLSIKNVEVSDCYYGFKVDYANAVSMENVKIANDVTIGIYDSNYGTKTYTIKGSTLNATTPIKIWERNQTTYTTFKFEGKNTIASLPTSTLVKYEGVIVGNSAYGELTDALADVKANDVLNIHSNYTLDKSINVTGNLTINGNGKTLTYTGSGQSARAITVESTANGANLTVNKLTIDCTASYCQRGINYNTTGELTLNNVTVKGENVTYALNLPGSSVGANVTINNSSLTGNIALNVWGKEAVINATGSHFTSVDNSTAEGYSAIALNNDGTTSAEGAVVNINGGTITAKDENGELSNAVRNSTANGTINVSESTDVTGNFTKPVAIVTYENTTDFYSCATFQAAIDKAIATNGAVKLISDVEASEIIAINGTVAIDGNGKKLTSIAARAINVETEGKVAISNLTINAAERAINIINKPATVELNGVTARANNNAVMIATSAGAANVTIDECDFTGLAVVNVAGAKSNVAIKNSTITNVDATDTENYGAITVWTSAEEAVVNVENTTITVADDSKKAYVFPATATVNGVDEVGYIIATVGDAGFDTLTEAISEANDGETITLIRDAVGAGVVIDKNITIDFNGKTYTVNKTVGSAGTTTLGFQILKENNVVLKNGTLKSTAVTKGKEVKMLIQNYANLTVENMNLVDETEHILYVLSNNSGNVAIKGNTNITTDAVAFDACKYASYEAPEVTVAEGVTVNGNVEVSATLNMNGTLNGEIVLNATTGVVNGAEGYNVTTNVDGSKVAFENGKYTVIAKTYTVTIGETGYETLAEAIAAATAGNTITFLADITGDVTISKNLTIDGNGKNYTGTMTVNNVTATIQNVAFVKGQVYKHKSTGSAAIITIKDCTFDGQDLNAYAVNVGNGKSLTIENVTAQNYGYGLLQVPSSFSSISVKNVEVSGMSYGFKVDYAGAVSMENVKIADDVTTGIYDSNFGDKTYTIKNSEISSISIWERSAAKTTTFKFEGLNKVGALTTSQYAKIDAESKSSDNLYGNLAAVVKATSAGATVELFKNIVLEGGYEDTTEGLRIEKAMTLDGKGHTIDCGTFQKGIRLYAPNNLTDVKINNVTIINDNVNGRCVDTRAGLLRLKFNKANLIATNGNSQPLTVGGSDKLHQIDLSNCTIDAGNSGYGIISFVPTNQAIKVMNTNITGYAGVYLKGDGTKVTITTNSKVIGKNVYAGASNGFGAVVIEGNNNVVNVNETSPILKAIAEGEATQAAILVKSGENNSVVFATNKKAQITNEGENSYWAMVSNEAAGTTFTKDDVALNLVAECGGFQFVSFDEAMRFAQDGDTVKLLSNVNFTTQDCVTDCDGYSSIINVEGMALTLDLNGKAITVNAHAEDLVDAQANMFLAVISTDNGGKLTIKDSSEAGTGSVSVRANDAKVYSLITNYTTDCQIIIENGNFFADKVSDSLIYSGSNADKENEGITVNGGNFFLGNIGTAANGSPWIFNAYSKNERHINVNGGTFNADINHQYWAFEVNVPATRALSKIDETTWTMVDAEACVLEKYNKNYNRTVGYATLEEAIAVENNVDNTVTLAKDVEMEDMITIANGETLVLDLNGKTLSATDNTAKNYSAIDNRGDLTIKDTTGEGKMTVKATTKSGWNRYSAVIANNPGGKLTVNGGTIEHLGGTDMAYGIDNLTNGKGTYAETIINDGYVKSPYRAVRQFLNGEEAQNILTVNCGTIEGANKSIFFHDPSTKANSGTLNVSENAALVGDVYLFVTANSTAWPVEVKIAKARFQGEVVSANVPADYYVTEYDEFWTVEPKNVAELTIKDGCSEYVNYNERNVGKLTYVRDFLDTEWQTIYLPFNLTYTEEIAAQFEIAYIYDAKYDENNGTTIDFVQITNLGTVLFANYPYMIRAKEAGMDKMIVAENTTLAATAEKSIDCSSVFETFTFTGKYNTMEASELTEPNNGYFVLDGGKWEKLEVVNPFRFYMTIAMRNGEAFIYNETVNMRRVDENGNPSLTSVDTVEVDKDAEFIFDLQGRRVITPERGGIYIINGNKVIY